MKASVASIDKRETVLLPNQITVDGTVLGKLNEMLVYGRDFHQEKITRGVFRIHVLLAGNARRRCGRGRSPSCPSSKAASEMRPYQSEALADCQNG